MTNKFPPCHKCQKKGSGTIESKKKMENSNDNYLICESCKITEIEEDNHYEPK